MQIPRVVSIVGATGLFFAGLCLGVSQTQTAPFAVGERGADFRVLQNNAVEHGSNVLHQYVELASGLNYTNASGDLVESKEAIELLPQGGAAAVEGQHKVYFPAGIYNGVLEIVTPDGRHLRSRPLGVSYDDGNNAVWVGLLQNSTGVLASSNKVVYPNAFSGLKADLVCTYRRGGFECDVVLRERPPAPSVFNLNTNASTLQLITEFFETDDPEEIPAGEDLNYGITDDTLKFGKMTMRPGKAFVTQMQTANPRLPNLVFVFSRRGFTRKDARS
jgi:hypothetical protein